MKRFSLLAILLASAPAAADDPAPTPPQLRPAEPPEPARDPQIDALTERLRQVEQELAAHKDELANQKDDSSYLEEKLQALLPLANKLTGYVDVGFFATDGDGAGTRPDLIGTYFPEYAGIVPGSWVFMGDPLSTAINSRGEPADTGDSRAVLFDPINSHGKSTFLVNAVNLALFSGIGETGQVNVSVDFLPRARDVSDPNGLFLGDYLDVKLAYGEWRPKLESFSLSLQAGKFDSVIGYEYRSLESPDRVGVTPSLICRYTCGRPIGLKARAKFLDDALVVNVALTNGSHFSEGFTFANETDTNQWKTTAGRLSYLIGKKVEIGVSGAFGAQDFQPDNDVFQWHVGGDIHAELGDLELTAELVKGKAPGKTAEGSLALCDLAPCLDYKGAYGLAAYRLTNVFVPYARVDWRDAVHQSGASFVYISDLVRFTVGLRTEIGSRVILKAEGTLNRELGRVPQFPNDVVTTSLVIKY